MEILVLNGSPAGKNSITLQTMLYLEKHFPDHTYTHLNCARQIKALEKDFSEAASALSQAELIIFCYPVYTFLVPAQLHRFIELMKEKGPNLSGKYALQITTSKHFYDTTAHRFIQDNCADLGLSYLGGLSADMEDLLKEQGQKAALSFFDHALYDIDRKICIPASAEKRTKQPLMEASVPTEATEKQAGKHIAVVADLSADNVSLKHMVDRFTALSPWPVTLVDLHEFHFAGGCLGCFNCASDGTCIYKDGFADLLRNQIQTCDATVYAFTIKDHSMGSVFKFYDDRQFCNGHRTVTMGKPVGYLIDGHLSDEPNLKTLMEARAQVGGNFLAGTATNETDPDTAIDHLLSELSYALSHNYTQPKNFYGVGGLKIFRDLIYQMQGLMKEDHRFYKANGFYDFPQKKKGTILGMYLVSALMKNKKLMKKSGMSMTDGMLRPYKKILEKPGK